MSDLTKALGYRSQKFSNDMFAHDKLEIGSRITELTTEMTKNQNNITSGMSEVDTRIKSVEDFKTLYNNTNKLGSKQYVKGDFQVNEKAHFKGDVTGAGSLDFEGAVKSNGNVLASENFVLANASSGAQGNVDSTLTYRFEAEADQKVFTYHFIGSSTSVYLGGLKLDTTDYDLTQAEYNDDGSVKTESKVTLKDGANEGDIIHCVAFGGADFFTRTQSDAKFLTLIGADAKFATKTELGEAVRRSACMGYFDSLTSDRIDSRVTLPITVTMKTPDIEVDNDNDTITVGNGGMYYIAWQVEITKNSIIDTDNWIYPANLHVDGDEKTGYDSYSLSEKYHSFSFNKTILLEAGDVISFKCHDNGNKIEYSSGGEASGSLLVMKIG